MRYLSIKNLTQYQHYKNRRPPWIKLHAEILDDYAVSCLLDASKLHFIYLTLLASQMDNRIPYDLAFISRKLGTTSPIDVEELVLQGFIEVSQDDGKPLASGKQMPIAEAETEKRQRQKTDSSAASAEPHKRSRKSDPKYPHYPTDVCTQLYDTYRRTRGPIDYATFRRETAVLFPTHYTPAELTGALEAWGDWVAALPPDKARWERPSTWVREIERWARLGAMPLVDLTGVTERGRLAVGLTA